MWTSGSGLDRSGAWGITCKTIRPPYSLRPREPHDDPPPRLESPLRPAQPEQTDRRDVSRRRRPRGPAAPQGQGRPRRDARPLASGVLVVCVGSATRLIEYVQRMPKTYRARVRLGATSDTLDADGTVVETLDARVPDEAEVRRALATQVGTISQMPPDFSALKVDGKRAYDLARAGRRSSWPAACDDHAGRPDLLRLAGSGAGDRLRERHLYPLDRPRRRRGPRLRRPDRGPDADEIGPFTIESAIDPGARPRGHRPSPPAARRSGAELAAGHDRPGDATAIVQGRTIEAGSTFAAGEVALIGPGGALLAIAEVVEQDVGWRRGVLNPGAIRNLAKHINITLLSNFPQNTGLRAPAPVRPPRLHWHVTILS